VELFKQGGVRGHFLRCAISTKINVFHDTFIDRNVNNDRGRDVTHVPLRKSILCEDRILWSIGDIEREDREYILMNFFQRRKKRGSMMVIIPRQVVDAKHFHNRFVRRKNLGTVINGRRQGIQP
jgi:hypothetical protein